MENVNTFHFVRMFHALFSVDMLLDLFVLFCFIEKDEKHDQCDTMESESVGKVVEETDKLLVSVLII